MENKYLILKLEEKEINIIQIALAEYILKNKSNIIYTENAKILLNNINFYKKQKND